MPSLEPGPLARIPSATSRPAGPRPSTLRACAAVVPAGLVLALALALAAPARAQESAPFTDLPPGDPGPREILDREYEIALARSAAPPAVSAGATVLVLERGGYAVAEEGTTDVTCHVSRDWKESLEPLCFDAEGSRTILPIFLRRAELRERGLAPAEIEADIADGLRTGRLRLPTRPAVGYMMSSEQVLIAPDGRDVGAWRPHVMIYYPFLEGSDVGLSDPPGLPVVMAGSGTATAAMIVVVPDFVEPELPDTEAAGGGR